MLETNGKFYLGRTVDQNQPFDSAQDKPLLYDPGDLTTHAMVVGMTGSGKTGLCIDLLEEAALQGIPSLMIDPKGDITNLLLHFPDLLPADFEPWVDPDEARRAGKSLEAEAAQAAGIWSFKTGENAGRDTGIGGRCKNRELGRVAQGAQAFLGDIPFR